MLSSGSCIESSFGRYYLSSKIYYDLPDFRDHCGISAYCCRLMLIVTLEI